MDSVTFEAATCLGCGLACDDIAGEVRGDRVLRAERLCDLGHGWLQRVSAPHAATPQIDGREAAWDDALGEAARRLAAARAPLVTGLTRSSVDAVRAAAALADQLGATIDPLVSAAARANLAALQDVGLSTCSLGELRHHADYLLCWRVDPVQTHPRLLERFVEPAGVSIPGGRRQRRLALIAAADAPAAAWCDFQAALGPLADLPLLRALRAEITGVSWEEAPAERADHVPRALVVELARQLQTARYAAVLWGAALGAGPCGAEGVAELARLVRVLNESRRCVALPLSSGDRMGTAEQVLAWQTGYAQGVDFAAGYPRYDPTTQSTQRRLAAGECDVAVLCGVRADDLAGLSSAAQKGLADVDVIAVGGTLDSGHVRPGVYLPTARLGYTAGGVVARLDGTLLPARALVASSLPDEATVLRQVADAASFAAR